MKTNDDKCHLIASTNSSSEKLLGFNTDSNLNFDCHVNYLYSKANKKNWALARVYKSVCIYHNIIQALPIGMFKVKHKRCPEITRDIFMKRTNNQYNLHNCIDFITPQVNSAYHGTESISYLGRKIWDIVPEEFKQETTKEFIKMCVPTDCLARRCKVFLDGDSFINKI